MTQQELEKYLNGLSNLCYSYINEKFTNTNFNNYNIINSFLIDNVIENANDNLFIKIPNKDLKRDFYIPLFFSIAHSLFFKNYIENKTAYKIGDTVQDNYGKRFKIIEKYDEKYILDGPYKVTVFGNNIEKYFVTTAKVSKRTVKTKFDTYRRFYNELFPSVTTFPSKFSYKAILIVEKKELIETLKCWDSGFELRKIIPFKWITKQGIKGRGSEFLPIEPMIYIAPDYETAKEFAFNKIDNLDIVVFVGKNKYINHLSEISKDIRLNKIPKAIIIGSEPIIDINNTKIWEWTQKELNYFNEVIEGKLNIINVEPEGFLSSLDSLNKIVSEIESKYSIHLNGFTMFKRYVYSLIIPNYETRLSLERINSEGFYRNILKEEIEELFFNIGENSEEVLIQVDELIVNIFNNITSIKFDLLISNDEKKILLVPKRLLTTLENLDIDNVVIFSVKKFLENEKRYTTEKDVYLLSIFGFEYNPEDLIKTAIESRHNINFILYPEESEICKKKINQITNKVTRIISHKDRKALTGIEFVVEEKSETLSEKLERLSEADSDVCSREYHPLDGIEYEIIYEDGDSDTLLGGKSVLLIENSISRKEKVSFLKIGDTVRVYSNEVPELLYKIAKSSGEEYFEEIEKYSKLWKGYLRKYSQSLKSKFKYENEEKKLKYLCDELAYNGGKVKENTIKNWIKQNSKTMFPQKHNLVAIRKMINDVEFDNEFQLLLKNKRLYESMMIALGRDLSDEVVDYVSSKKRNKGEILEKYSNEIIDTLVKGNAPERSITEIKPIGEPTDE